MTGLLIFSTLLAGADAQAASLFGGRVAESPQLYFHAGYPSTELGFHLPIGDRFELTPWARFRFAWGTTVGSLWTGPGLDMRAHIFGADQLSGALVFTFGAEFLLNGGFFGAQISLGHPGMMLSYGITDELDLDFGLRVQPYLLVGDFVDFSISVPAFFGVSFEVDDKVELGFRGHGGPWIDEDGVINADVGALFFVGFDL